MRVKGSVNSRRRHKKILKAVKGYVRARSKLYKVAKESYLHAGQYALQGRRKRTGQMRSLWITRLNAAIRNHGYSYSQFMNMLKKSKVELNRKSLSELAIQEPEVFSRIVEKVKA
jgi:large subunit ribosomal protein L20